VAGIKKVALARRREVFQGQFGHFTGDSTRLRQAALLAEHDVALISPTSKQARLRYICRQNLSQTFLRVVACCRGPAQRLRH